VRSNEVQVVLAGYMQGEAFVCAEVEEARGVCFYLQCASMFGLDNLTVEGDFFFFVFPRPYG